MKKVNVKKINFLMQDLAAEFNYKGRLEIKVHTKEDMEFDKDYLKDLNPFIFNAEGVLTDEELLKYKLISYENPVGTIAIIKNKEK